MSPVSWGAGLGEADTPKANTKQRVAQNDAFIKLLTGADQVADRYLSSG